MATFNVTDNMTQAIDLLPFVNNISGGFLGYIIIIMIAAVSLVITASFNIRDSHIASAFITAIAAQFLFIMGLVDGQLLLVCYSLLVGATFMSAFAKGSEGA